MITWIVTSSVLILIVLLLRQLVKPLLRKSWQYAVWLVVLVRLLVPFQLGTSPLSLDGIVSAWQEQTAVSYAAPPAATEPPPVVSEPPVTDSVPSVPTPTPTPTPAPASPAPSPLFLIWIAGMIGMGGWLLVGNAVFTLRLLRTRKRIGTFHSRRVFVSESLETPCLHGLFRPAIYLTPQAAESSTAYSHTVEHEWTHYRHGDGWWSLLRGAALVLHWYNPLVWLAATLSRRDGELCCDESTVRRLGEDQRHSYGETLLRLTCQAPRPSVLLSTATTMAGSLPVLKERLSVLVRPIRTRISGVLLLTAVVLFSAVFTLTGAAETVPAEPTVPDVVVPTVTTTTVNTNTTTGVTTVTTASAPTPAPTVPPVAEPTTPSVSENTTPSTPDLSAFGPSYNGSSQPDLTDLFTQYPPSVHLPSSNGATLPSLPSGDYGKWLTLPKRF